MPSDTLGVLLISGSHERAHYALVLATGAAAVGRSVVLLATNAGCHALLEDWSGLADAGRDAAVRNTGVAGFAELREAAGELGVRMIACEAGVLMAGLAARPLAAGIERAGVATFLEATRGGQLISL